MSRALRIGIVCDHRDSRDYPYQMVGDEYAEAVKNAVGGVPLLIPSLPSPLDPNEVLHAADGFLFTGSPSNVGPKLYGGTERPMARDDARDALALPLLRAAIEKNIPVFCICRGFQELNVALGGTLHQQIHNVPGFSDHRPDKTLGTDAQYRPAHDIVLEKGGVLETIARDVAREDFKVNSLHGQGIDRLAPGLRVEARSADGVIEAVSLKEPNTFLLGVQWHPEWRWRESSLSRALFAAFGDAARILR